MSTYKMLSYDYKRMFHPRLGRFVYKHKGSGLIVDNIFNPMKRIMKKALNTVMKPLAKKALKSGIESGGKKLGETVGKKLGKKVAEKSGKKVAEKSGKKVAEKSGHLFMKDLQKKVSKPKPKQQKVVEEDYNMILNRLISGSGINK